MALVALAASVLAEPRPARAQDRPATIPTRDVDVTYMMIQSDAPGGARMLEQRMRWDVTSGKLRVDPPTPGLYMIMDFKTHRLDTVREAERMVIELNAAATTGTPGVASGASFKKRGEANVGGLACTQWETRDASGELALVCLTPDGVLLRVASAGRVLMEAAAVTYAPIDPGAFRIPDGYRHVGPPQAPAPPRPPAAVQAPR